MLDAGFDRDFTARFLSIKDPERFSNGVAAADYDADGDVDLYVVGGRTQPNHLYQNQGDGTYVEVGASVALDINHWGSGPAFGDVDGDGDLDLFIGAGDGDPVYLFENRLDATEAPSGVFVDATAESGILVTSENTVSAAFYDYDADGYLDLFLSHWGADRRLGEDTETVWRNNGDFTFTSASIESGVAAAIIKGGKDWSFTPILSDIDNDGDGDLLMVSDLNHTEVLVNNGDGTFMSTTDTDVIADQAGMGTAVGDYDNDGDMDWFVTSIYTLDVGGEHFGNRLYRNDGDGTFTDVDRDRRGGRRRLGLGQLLRGSGQRRPPRHIPRQWLALRTGQGLHHRPGPLLPLPGQRHLRRARRGGGPGEPEPGPRPRLLRCGTRRRHRLRDREQQQRPPGLLPQRH